MSLGTSYGNQRASGWRGLNGASGCCEESLQVTCLNYGGATVLHLLSHLPRGTRESPRVASLGSVVTLGWKPRMTGMWGSRAGITCLPQHVGNAYGSFWVVI